LTATAAELGHLLSLGLALELSLCTLAEAVLELASEGLHVTHAAGTLTSAALSLD